ncbi:MAG: aminoacetone oxidase family FAD-binding enzyme [Elusimicrobia bacterium]|nr:aminoacetone oxidase family FAD-binding enzyme [Elusimicrobiota bacterium]
MPDIWDAIIVGAGAAGLIAAAELGGKDRRVLVLEGQKRPARKLLITGGGRCNLTNASVGAEDYTTRDPRTLRHVLQVFPPQKAVSFFERAGVALVCEEDGKYFTADGRAGQIVDALMNAAVGAGARVLCEAPVLDISFQAGIFHVRAGAGVFSARAVLVGTGGLSYPSTGSTGAGFEIARRFGHTLVAPAPGLVPLLTRDKAYAMLAGLTLSVRLSLWSGGKKTGERSGSFLFTHEGFSGPVALEMGGDWERASRDRKVTADLVPAIPSDEIERVLMDDASRAGIFARLSGVIPRRLAGFLVEQARINVEGPANLLRREDRKRVLGLLKEQDLSVRATAGFDKAEITTGGVDLRELHGATLESRKQSGLFFAGEVLDVAGRVGGFNLQWAWASGVAAAQGILRSKK